MQRSLLSHPPAMDQPLEPPGFDLDHFLPYQVAVLARRLSLGLAAVYRGRFGLSIPEWRVIAHLAREQDVSVREIQARVDLDKSKVSRAVTRLEARGLVSKRGSATDRRLLVLALTAEGRDLYDQIVPLALAYEAQLLRSLGDEASGARPLIRRLIQASGSLGASE